MLHLNHANSSEEHSQYIPTDKEGFVYVTQDGAAIIFNNTFPNIKGLYTVNLQTCIAIVILGGKGIALLHCTRKFSLSNLSSVFEELGTIQAAYICYNDHPFYQTGISDNKERILPTVKKYTNNIQLLECHDGYVGVERNHSILQHPSPLPSSIIFPIYVYLRNWINITNNYFLEPEEEMPADVQFNGHYLTPIPSLNKKHEEIKTLYFHDIQRSGIVTADKMKKTHDVLTRILIGRTKLIKSEYAQIGMDEQVVGDIYSWLDEQLKVEITLNSETNIFFSGPSQYAWKVYPESRLIGKYVGHQVRYLTLSSDMKEQAKVFVDALQGKGFCVTLKEVNAKPSIIVDLSDSKLIL